MEIQKPGFGNYDPQYIQVVRGETARSIKPNTFQEVPDEVQLALWLTDLVELSPEAKALLKKLGKEKTKGETRIDWDSLLGELDDVREVLRKKREEGKSKDGKTGKKGDAKLNFLSLPVMRPPLQEVLPRDGDGKKSRPSPASAAAALLDKMIVRSADDAVRRGLVAELEQLGVHIVSACKDFGVRIIVLNRGELLSDLRIHQMALTLKGEKTSDGRLKDDVRGMYFEDRRLIVIGRELVGVPGELTSVHEFAHAYDHAFSERHHRMHHLSTQLWNLFEKSRTAFITAYASTKPAEYFAESVEAYFIPAKTPVLQKHDPQMYEFLSNLFQGRAG